MRMPSDRVTICPQNMPYPLGEPIGASQSTVFPCRVSQDFPLIVIKIYDSDQDVLPETANPEDGPYHLATFTILCPM